MCRYYQQRNKPAEALIKDDPEALEMWDDEMKGSHGGDRRSDSFKDDNVNFENIRGGLPI